MAFARRRQLPLRKSFRHRVVACAACCRLLWRAAEHSLFCRRLGSGRPRGSGSGFLSLFLLLLLFSFFSFFSSFFWRARRAAFPAGGFSAFALPQTQSLAPARPPIAREPQRACAAQRAAFFSEIRPEDQIKSDQIRSDTGLDAKTQIQIRPDTSPKKHRSDQTGAYSDKTKPDGGPNR